MKFFEQQSLSFVLGLTCGFIQTVERSLSTQYYNKISGVCGRGLYKDIATHVHDNLTVSNPDIEKEVPNKTSGINSSCGSGSLSQCYPNREYDEGKIEVIEQRLLVHGVPSQGRTGRPLFGTRNWRITSKHIIFILSMVYRFLREEQSRFPLFRRTGMLHLSVILPTWLGLEKHISLHKGKKDQTVLVLCSRCANGLLLLSQWRGACLALGSMPWRVVKVCAPRCSDCSYNLYPTDGDL